jgi:hypothetical protein
MHVEYSDVKIHHSLNIFEYRESHYLPPYTRYGTWLDYLLKNDLIFTYDLLYATLGICRISQRLHQNY